MIEFDWHPGEKQLKQFGWISLFGFPLIGLLLWWKFGAPAAVLWSLVGAGVIVLVLSLIEAALVRLVFVGLTLIALPIGFVVATTLMAFVFFGMVTPLGIVFRLTGRDRVSKRPDASLPTYWIQRGEPRPKADYFKTY